MTPDEHCREAERLLAEWQQAMTKARHRVPSILFEGKLAAAQVHATLATLGTREIT